MSIATLASTPYVPFNVTSSSSASGYPATNVTTGKVLKPWRSTTAALSEYIIFDLGSNIPLTNAMLTISAANLVDAQIFADTWVNPTTSKGVITFAADGSGRYKASIALSGTIHFIKIKPNSGAPTDGAGFWQIGPVDLFLNSRPLPRDPIFGETSIDSCTPQTRTDLENGIVVKDDTGPPYSTITLNFTGGTADDHEAVMRTARAGLCWLDLGIASNRGLQWRVKHYEAKTTRKLTAFNRESVQITLKEEV